MNDDYSENHFLEKYRDSDNTNKEQDNKIESNSKKQIIGTASKLLIKLWTILLTKKKPWIWFAGIITDGYALTLLSPFILTYWILFAILYVPLFVIVSILVIISTVWMILFEVPAAVLNKEDIDKSFENLHWNGELIVVLFVFGVIIITVLSAIISSNLHTRV